MSRIREYAKKTFLAMKNPAGSVQEVFVNALDRIGEENDCQYMGVKNVRQIPADLVKKLEGNGFALHTLDRHSHNGRAVDYNLHNPITGRPMTGSSSGTAINVFLGINDLGIGTDGGGSVLAPAAAVN
ncbi:amidase family protein, partial [Faecalibaculum rodentium]